VNFLAACEYEEVKLEHAMGDELFMALHLIMKDCKDYMKHLQNYHNEQEYSLGSRQLLDLKELKMKRLTNYHMVPSPEMIRAIVAECITVSPWHSSYFIDAVRRTGVVKLPNERDNGRVIQRIMNLEGFFRGHNLTEALCKILTMPASAVGACHSFQQNDVLMDVAMRQFGIALLVVHEDDGKTNTWPYRTQNFLERLGSGYFLPLTFGLIHVSKDGSLSILRKRIRAGRENFSVPCYRGYALDMQKDILEGKVNLIKGLFDVSYTNFAGYILRPRACQNKMRFPKVRDYRGVEYMDLVWWKNRWDDYQEWVQDAKRTNKQKKEEAKRRAQREKDKQPPADTAAGAGEPTLQDNEENDEDDEGEKMSAEHNLSSYVGNTEEKKKENRIWFHNDYQRVWPAKAEMEDLTGQKMTLDQSLRLWGKSIKTKQDCNAFFDDDARNNLLEEIRKTWRQMSKHIHTDKFNARVVDEGMRKFNNEKFSALNTAKEALEEWHQEAQKAPNSRKDDNKLNSLHTWEGEIYVYQSEEILDYDTEKKKKQTKKRKTKK
jgi:hypothetical protein